MKVLIRKINESAVLPEYQTSNSAGMDLSACLESSIVILPHDRVVIPTGLAIALPAGYEAQVRGRSGLAAKYGIMPANGIGTIDADYRGEIMVILLNTSNQPFTVDPGMRVAQIVISKYETVKWDIVTDLDETLRGSGRFGSTGV